jgi:pantoate--beta-alanine ligase
VKIVRTIAELRTELEPVRAKGSSVGLVPTMGALHAGHVSLFAAAQRECDCVVASVFVNPAQFAPQEDFARYPRDERRDEQVAAEAGVDFLFAPAADELYPRGYQTWVDVERLSRTLEGAQRPGHFRGVATICLKLFNIVRPQRAYFGQKDAQQALTLRRMVEDLHLDVELRLLPTVRDDDGLALSSRNAYLSPADRALALTLPRALQTRDRERARKILADAGVETDYVDVLEDDGVRVLAGAIRVGSTRLIDNVPLEGGPE